ncbi:hypothetical protein FFV02_22950 [Salmonella enterica]|nr:hypothetical protein [Salmonella enterica]EGK3392596.1 hypothetical protein [Salmonella enterica subsp. enterica serovar Typhimurium]EAW4292516.1 hypothetical protein [Salmonella enterica]EAW4306454.1 hypothetical protein [Salmonella enterica]EGK3401586.1 hypothetical protein [Salmonella enterica subsp. enterica serovar Typhimurium]
MTEKQYPSEQYLKELLSNTEFASAAPVEVVRCMAKELLKYREAKPVAWASQRSLDVRCKITAFTDEDSAKEYGAKSAWEEIVTLYKLG